MTNSQILDAINQNIKQNGNEEITGVILNSILRMLLDFVNKGFITFSDIIQLLADSKTVNVVGSISSTTDTTSLPSGVYHAQTSGTYANAGNIVVKEGYYTLLRKKDDGTWVLESEVKMPMQDLSKIESSIDEINNIIDALGVDLEYGATDVIVPKQGVKIWNSSDVLNYNGFDNWYTARSNKSFNLIGIPIVRGYGTELTGGIKVQIAVNNTWVLKDYLIPFSVVEKFNDIPLIDENINKLFHYISLENTDINNGDVIFIGLKVENVSDNLGFIYTQTLTDEWATGYGGLSLKNNNNNYDTPPIRVDNSNQYIIKLLESSDDLIGNKIRKELENSPMNKKYFSKDLVRQNIGSFLGKLRSKKDVKVVCYGDSITSFQNSETLTLEEQKINPIGLSGNSWLRQLWNKLRYYQEDIQYRRFDHSDFTFSNGIQQTSDVIGSNGWATTRNDTTEPWRNNIFNTGFAQSIFSGSSFNKPLVGTNKTGQTITITIPSTATELSIYTNTYYNNQMINIKINDGSSDIVSENVNINDGSQPYENIVKYSFASGASKTLTITTLDSNVVFFWGVSYKSNPAVRLINSGSGSYNIDLLSNTDNFQKQVSNHNPDLVVFEVCSSNDANMNITLTEHMNKVDLLFNQLKELNVPVLVLMTHRFEEQKLNRAETSIVDQNSVKFIPELIKNYKSASAKYGFGVIDIFSKSIDILGNTNKIVLPPNFFVDAGHLGVLGNKMYFEELDKLFFEDFE